MANPVGRPRTKVLDQILEEDPVNDTSAKETKDNPNMTQEERAIFSRVISESNKDWSVVDPYAVVDYSLAQDPFKFPEPAIKLRKEKKFNFRWVRRSSERLDELKNLNPILRWWPVNSTQPIGGLFDSHIDSMTGGVHMLDQILVFKPWALWEKEEEYQNKLAGAREDITARDGSTKNELSISAGRRKEGEGKPSRAEITGSDIVFRGEEDIDMEAGRLSERASEADLSVTE